MTAARRTKSRWASKPLQGRSASLPAFDHPAIMGGHTIYPTTVRPARSSEQWALKSGDNSHKIGGVILKGRWKGFPVYTLTLEERATCPHTCHHWRSCFGNHMHLADRVEAGADLEWRLEREVALLAIDHPKGFAIRLHVLGDFYSVGYVTLWRRLLTRHAGLHVFGMTARQPGDPIGDAVAALVAEHWDRFAVRISDGPPGVPSTVSIEHPFNKPPDAVICPAEMKRTESCSTCALCWQSKRPIAFVQH